MFHRSFCNRCCQNEKLDMSRKRSFCEAYLILYINLLAVLIVFPRIEYHWKVIYKLTNSTNNVSKDRVTLEGNI